MASGPLHPNLLMPKTPFLSPAPSRHSLCSAMCGVFVCRQRRRRREARGGGRKAERRIVDVILCFLLQPLNATEWWQPGVDHQCRFSLSLSPSLSRALSLPSSLIHTDTLHCPVTCSLPRTRAACAHLGLSLLPPCIHTLLPLARHTENIDISYVLRQLAVETRHGCKSEPRRAPASLSAVYIWKHKQNWFIKGICNFVVHRRWRARGFSSTICLA